jgi:dihydroceramidase
MTAAHYLQGLHHHAIYWRIHQHAHEHDLRLDSPITTWSSTKTILTQSTPVVYGAQGLRRVQPRQDGGLFSTLAFPYWGLIGVGVLSAWFHSTLKYHSQMGDDLSMFLAVGALLHQLLCFEATLAQRRKYTVAILGSLIPVSVYHVWADEIYVHEIVFAVMVFMVSRRTRALIKRRVVSEESRKKLGKMATFGICRFGLFLDKGIC